jgi:dolichyl-phosphate-mannose--protein O-mannosyl transferase
MWGMIFLGYVLFCLLILLYAIYCTTQVGETEDFTGRYLLYCLSFSFIPFLNLVFLFYLVSQHIKESGLGDSVIIKRKE